MRTDPIPRVLTLAFLLVLLVSPPLRAAEPAPAASAVPGRSALIADDLTPVPVPQPSALAVRYHETGNWIWGLSELWSLLVPAVLLFSGASARIRNVAHKLGRRFIFTVGIYILLFSAIVFLLDFPLHFYRGYLRQHAYGLSNQSFHKWFSNSVTQAGIGAVVSALFVWIPYLLIQRSPRRWWLYTTILTIPFLFVVVLVKPIWVDPLFNDFGPMKDKALEREILALADRAGISGSRIYEVNKSVDTKTVNAYVTGLLGSKRIVLWDTLLARLDNREVLVVMGHEMGHFVLGHVPRSILLSSLITLVSLFWVDRAGRWLIARAKGRFGFDQLSDVASIPLLLLLLQVASLALVPVANAYSRQQEHEADRFALEITRANRDAALAFVKLQEENLGVPRPGFIYRFWRGSHPSIGERIDFCNTYRPWAQGRPLRYSRWIRPESAVPR
ncbi:M48 family metallopeptidase [Singulisphaera acidiphila]|uniref:Zn-dependent protease with chaperone function n=1 Tax=Singulisphaera acidiphila (strain ATCC BAA-1392 / DSM 18658 / VKM B-2454 / MOB10) TaxID=886293 RepID=L0DB59_SINAD|nr:M48 family metallopeptidase [Singulisphaera acidiphila]AGA26100.1 Zn-dependent protease with chaperone function [Singulisphaera acidiphila DSM 18658]